LSPEIALVLWRKEIEQSSNQLLSAGYMRDDLRLEKIEELPKMISMLLAE
jgi:hypothetical protein